MAKKMRMEQLFNTRDEQVVLLTPGQVFLLNARCIEQRPCWMAVCHRENGDYFLPLLRRDGNFELLLRKRQQLRLQNDFCERQNFSFEMLVMLDYFLAATQDVNFDGSIEEQLHDFQMLLPGRALGPHTDYGQPFDRHFYLAPDENGQLLLMKFEDDMYRPQVWRARFDRGGEIRYRDMVGVMKKWKLLKEYEVEELFAGVGDKMINALNDGLGSFRKIEQAALGAHLPAKRTVLESNNVIGQTVEAILVPTVWFDIANQRVQLTHDFFGKWTAQASKKILLDVGRFRMRHLPEHGRLGLISLRRAEKAIE